MASTDTVTTQPLDTAPTQPGGIRGSIATHGGNLIDAAARAAGRADDPRVAQAKSFVAAKPLAVAAAAGVIGLALLNTLRGKR